MCYAMKMDGKEVESTQEPHDPLPEIFSALSQRRFQKLLSLEPKENLHCILPCLCRATLYPAGSEPALSTEDRNKLRSLLLEFSRTNTLVSYMSVDFSVLESDLRKETKLRNKTMNASTNGSLDALFTAFTVAAIGHRFEIGDPAEKFRLLLSEILTMQLILKEAKSKFSLNVTTAKSRSSQTAVIVKQLRRFEPLDNEAYLSDCCDLLVTFLSERPNAISVEELCEILVYYRNGPIVIRSITINFPDTWFSTCYHLIDGFNFGFVGDDRSLIPQKRMEALSLLCSLDRRAAAELVSYCVEKRKFRLAISLGLRFLPPEFVGPLVSAALASADDHQRGSLIGYIQTMQKEWSVLRDFNLPKTTKRSVAPKTEGLRTPISAQDRVQYTEADETILDIIGQDSETIVDLKRIRELWEQDEDRQEVVASSGGGVQGLSTDVLAKALREASRRPSVAILALRRILRSNRGVQSEYIDALTESFPALLDPSVPLHVVQLTARLWSKIEPMAPRRLYVSTIAALLPPPRFSRLPLRQRASHLELCKDPLTILRCDERVFRCAPLLSLLLRVLRCYLAAGRAYLQRELASATISSTGRRSSSATANPQAADAEKEELMRSLIGAQESAAIQILLEACLPQQSEQGENSHLTALREIRCIICSFVHQMFISDPILSKLVHFQTYPSELLEVTVTGIPSMHICLDFIPELLAQPIQPKRVFAVNLLSFLCEHYAIPKAFNIARLAINVLSTLIGVVASEEVVGIFSGLLPALLRFHRVFPPLSPDISSLLGQVSRICQSRMAASDGVSSMFIGPHPWGNLLDLRSSNCREASLLYDIHDVFRTELRDG